jgi:hypothetical protein
MFLGVTEMNEERTKDKLDLCLNFEGYYIHWLCIIVANCI